MRPFIAFLLLLGLTMSGCTQSTLPVASHETKVPTLHAPMAVVEYGPMEGGTSSVPRWALYVEDWPMTLPRHDAELNVSIVVYGIWHYKDTVEPFEGENWTVRLHVEDGTRNSTKEFHPPPGADWFRSYTLTGVRNATVTHPTSFFLGDLQGEKVEVWLTYHKIFESGYWEAWEARVVYLDEGDTYRLDGGPGGRIVCSPDHGRCPWSGEYGSTSSPPPHDW